MMASAPEGVHQQLQAKGINPQVAVDLYLYLKAHWADIENTGKTAWGVVQDILGIIHP